MKMRNLIRYSTPATFESPTFRNGWRSYMKSTTNTRIADDWSVIIIIIIIIIIIAKPLWAVASLHCSHGAYRRPSSCEVTFRRRSSSGSWVEQCLTSHQTHYRSYRGRVLGVKWPNQQCQSTEGRHKTKLNQIQQNTKMHLN